MKKGCFWFYVYLDFDFSYSFDWHLLMERICITIKKVSLKEIHKFVHSIGVAASISMEYADRQCIYFYQIKSSVRRVPKDHYHRCIYHPFGNTVLARIFGALNFGTYPDRTVRSLLAKFPSTRVPKNLAWEFHACMKYNDNNIQS